MVSFTPNIGLAKPTNAEVAKDWIEQQEYQLTNDTQIMTRSNIALTAYTPTIIATTTPPNIGAGRIVGEYQVMDDIVWGEFAIEFTDPGVVGGSGEFAVSLPQVADSSFHTVGTTLTAITGVNSIIGEGYISDASNLSLSGSVALDLVTIAGVSYVRLVTEPYAAPVKTNRVFAAGLPSNLGTGDKWTGSFIYKK